jgi:WD40 repeat protein
LLGQLLALHAVCFSPDGRRLAAGTGDGGVNIWTWKPVAKSFS